MFFYSSSFSSEIRCQLPASQLHPCNFFLLSFLDQRSLEVPQFISLCKGRENCQKREKTIDWGLIKNNKPFLKKVQLNKFSYRAKISSSNATNKFDTTSSHHTSYCSLAAHEGKLKLSNQPFLLFYSSYYLFSCQNSIPFFNQ